MLTICLLTLSLTADPKAVESTRPAAVLPTATCSRPLIKVTEPSNVSAVSPSEIAESLAIVTLLRRWERSSQNRAEWSRSEREEFRQRMKANFNEHSVAAVEQLTGHLEHDWLCETFAWRLADRSPDQICLEGTPRDETERLFYGSLRVWLNADRGVPEQIVVVTRNQVHRVAWQSDVYLKNDHVQLVRFENEVPPAPKAVVKTANARIE